MRIVPFVGALAVLGCTTPTPPAAQQQPLQLETAHFLFMYPADQAAAIAQISAAAETDASRILEDLGAGGMPRVRVTYYSTHAAMADAVRPVAGSIPSWATGLVTSSTAIHLLSPSAVTPAQSAADAARTAVHELAHCVTLHLNPSMANNPRWLWETIALYEARQPGTSAAVATFLAGNPPRASDFNGFDSTTLYDVGSSIGEFIVAERGLAGMRALIQTAGDTQQTFGLTPDEFMAQWFSWARRRGE